MNNSNNSNNNLRGILFMIAAMGALALADTLLKLTTSLVSPAQALFYLVGGAFIVFALMAILQKDRLNDVRAFSPTLLLRYLTEVTGMAGMVMALTNVPLAVVGAIAQASPIFAAACAVLFLNENVGWRRWCCFIIGFIGVLFIVQPGALGFDFNVLWAILAMVSLAIRDLTTRLTPTDMTSTSLATFTMAAATPFTIAWVLYNGESLLPQQTNWLVVIPMVLLAALGYMLLTTSIRLTEVSIVMPFRYSRILFLLLLGMVVFDEQPGSQMLIGASLIVSSGTYMMWRERFVSKLA